MSMAGEFLFVDTNILLSATDRSRALHGACLNVLSEIPRAGAHLVVNAQVLREYLVVSTRPVDVNGLGLTAAQSLDNVAAFKERMNLLNENDRVHESLMGLVRRHKLKGKRIHDANIVATMAAHGIERLITADVKDYKIFKGIMVQAPGEFESK